MKRESAAGGRPASRPALDFGRRAAAALAVALSLSGCGSSSRDAEIVQALSDIREELKGLRQDLNRVQPQQVAAAREPQVEQRVSSIEVGSSPTLGNGTAKVALVEFSDYQCPFCARHHRGVSDEIKRKYVDSGRLLVVFKDFPLASHPEARPASIAARCSGKLGAYWAMQRAIFEGQGQLGPKFYNSTAERLGLDRKKFTACLDDPSVAQGIDADAAYGSQLGVSGTPSFFVGRLRDGKVVDAVKLSGAQPFPAFASKLDELLRSPG